jgi:hypothetical protein
LHGLVPCREVFKRNWLAKVYCKQGAKAPDSLFPRFDGKKVGAFGLGRMDMGNPCRGMNNLCSSDEWWKSLDSSVEAGW